MKDYSKGKIYTIRCRNDNSLIYVGSTIETLCKRFSVHRGHSKLEQYNNKMLYIEVAKTGWHDWYIELYDYCPTKTLEELLKREGEVTRLIGTLNKNIAGRTMKEYYIDNRTNILNNKTQYYVDNNERSKQYQKNYRTEHPEYNKNYYNNNKQAILEYQKIRYQNMKLLKLNTEQHVEENAIVI